MAKQQPDQPIDMEFIKRYVLEAARIFVIGLVSFFLTEGVIDALVTLFFGANLDPIAKLPITTALTIAIKSLDRALHDTKLAEKGIVRF